MLNIFKKSARILLAGYPIVLPISVLVVKLINSLARCACK